MHYSSAVGLAFQVQDDILDIEGEKSIVIGKTADLISLLIKVLIQNL